MQLTDRDKAMLDGKAGEAVRIAMSILADAGIRPNYLQAFLW
jgi:predicted aconitase